MIVPLLFRLHVSAISYGHAKSNAAARPTSRCTTDGLAWTGLAVRVLAGESQLPDLVQWCLVGDVKSLGAGEVCVSNQNFECATPSRVATVLEKTVFAEHAC